MTIVHITSSRNRSGGTRQALLLAAEQVRAGHRVILCAPPGAGIFELGKGCGIEFVPVPAGPLRSQWRSSRRLREIARHRGVDLIHTHHTKAHNIALLATLGGRFPPVVVNRGVLFRPEFPMKFRTRRTAAIITNSRKVAGVLEKCGVNPQKIHVVYNARVPADRTSLRRSGPALREELRLGNGPVVGAVSSARPEKGMQFLVEAAPQVLRHHPGAQFVLVGAGTDRFVPRLEQLGVRDRFRLPGHRSDAVAIMALFDVFVLPSVDMESCPNVLLEAMDVGLPVVGSDVGGVGEIVEHGRTGLVVPRGDPGALADAVCTILSLPDRGQAMGEAGHRKISEHFTPQDKCQRTLAVYERVLGR